MSAVALPRRFYSLLWVALLLVVVIFFICFREDAWSSIPSPPKSWRIPFTTDDGVLSSWKGSGSGSSAGTGGSGYAGRKPGEPLRIALVESSGTHDEVAAALMHAFGGQENSQLDVYFTHQRFKMPSIMGNFSLPANITVHKFDKFASAMTTDPRPHVLVSTTCEFDLDRGTDAVVDLLKKGETFLFCTIHHADRWHQGKYVQTVRGWVERGLVDFVGLSQHTLDFLVKETIPKWHSAANLTTRVIPPVFPVNVPDDIEENISLSIQGDYSSGRRDYNGIFNHLGAVIRKAKETTPDQQVALHLIGHGTTPEVPDHVKDHVVFDQGLSYPDFYSLISRSFAVIPAFASDTYFDRKASSTIPASFIAGAPLVVSEELLEAYSYIPKEATWVARPGESEMDVIERVMGDRDGYIKRRQKVRDTNKALMEQNHANTKEWIDIGLEKVVRYQAN
ncbi:hypothetical protein FALBO_5105 [Fusarium albosuccineum]|uniref:Uncharacterized protein n=1 Tax=Fusarium albosuccineum TaxID=1237068 RepID=A0A8H4LFE1_9HYPO|nr:hypothetical protein FALBO_5105 [Fusarium albosuccineum]